MYYIVPLYSCKDPDCCIGSTVRHASGETSSRSYSCTSTQYSSTGRYILAGARQLCAAFNLSVLCQTACRGSCELGTTRRRSVSVAPEACALAAAADSAARLTTGVALS